MHYANPFAASLECGPDVFLFESDRAYAIRSIRPHPGATVGRLTLELRLQLRGHERPGDQCDDGFPESMKNDAFQPFHALMGGYPLSLRQLISRSRTPIRDRRWSLSRTERQHRASQPHGFGTYQSGERCPPSTESYESSARRLTASQCRRPNLAPRTLRVVQTPGVEIAWFSRADGARPASPPAIRLPIQALGVWCSRGETGAPEQVKRRARRASSAVHRRR